MDDKAKKKKDSFNPRWKTGKRRKYQERFEKMGLPCHICGKPIDYSKPRIPSEPFSFVIDEIIPVSHWREFGYSSPAACADDIRNLAPAHRICNSLKGNNLRFTLTRESSENQEEPKTIPTDGKW